jgi:putative membrane protein
MKKAVITTVALAGILALVPAFAQTSATSTSTTKKTSTSTATSGLSAGDRQFMTTASQAGMMEVELGKIAAEKGTNPDVKAYGQRMVDDHTKAGDQLKQLASQKNVKLSDKLSPPKQKEVDKLGKLSGAAFDNSYISHMVSGHKPVVAAFEKESKSGKDTDVKSWAESTLPTLQDHLKLAQETSSKIHAKKK